MKQLDINEMSLVSGAGAKTADISQNESSKRTIQSSYNNTIKNIYESLSNSILNSLNSLFK